MANQRAYTTAHATLALNIGLALLLLAASAVSALIHRPLHDSTTMSVVVVYSGGIIFFFVSSLLFPAGLTNPMQVLGDLLCALQIPTALQQNNRRTGLCIAGGTLLLWIPAALITQFPNSEPVLYGVIFFLAFWIIFFRALYYAEQQTPCPITTQTDLKQQQKQTYALLLLAGLVCGFGTLPLLLQLAYRLLASEAQLAQTGNLFFLGIFAAIGLVTVIILAIFYRRHCRQMNAALEKLQLEHQVTQSQLYVDLLSQKYDTLRQYQHDFKQHLAHIQQLAQQNQTTAITAYISAIYDDLQNAAPLKLTGNQTLDLLLGDKLQQAQAQGVSLQIDYQPQSQLQHIAAPDLCIILGNLLDNAITAAAHSQRRQINCKFRPKNDYYTAIIVTNSCDQPPQMRNGLPQTQQDPAQHGYGVQNILQRAQAYGGHYQFTYLTEQQQFQAVVLLSTAAPLHYT